MRDEASPHNTAPIYKFLILVLPLFRVKPEVPAIESLARFPSNCFPIPVLALPHFYRFYLKVEDAQIVLHVADMQ